MKQLILLLFIFLITHLLLLTVSPRFLLEGDFPYKRDLHALYRPEFLRPIANFDGMQYIRIVELGYTDFQQSYFPLYPLVLKVFLGLFMRNYLIEGFVLSCIFFAGGLYMFRKLLYEILPPEKINTILASLLLFPTSFFYIIMYPESLYLLLSAAALYYTCRRKYLPAAIFCYIAALAKVQGVFLCIPLFIMAVFQQKAISKKKIVTFRYHQIIKAIEKRLKKNWRFLLITIMPIAGLLTYMAYLGVAYGNPFLFYHSQAGFHNGRTVNTLILLPQVLFRYIKILFNSDFTLQYFVATVEFVLFTLVLGVILYNLFTILKGKQILLPNLSLNLYSLTTLLLPTLTGTLSSTPRYALISLSFFVAVGSIRNNIILYSLWVLFSVLHVILFILFAQGYFVS